MNQLFQKIALIVLEETGWKPPTAAGAAVRVGARKGAGAGAPVAAKVIPSVGAANGRKVYVPAQGLNKSIVAAQTGNNAKVLAVVFKAGRKKGLTMPEVAKASGVIPKTVESCLYQLRTAKLVESRAQ